MKRAACILGALLLVLPALAQAPFLGRWALTPAFGGAGWLEVRDGAHGLEGTLLWVGGSPEEQTRVFVDGETLHCVRIVQEEIKDAAGNLLLTQPQPILVTANLTGDTLAGTFTKPAADGKSAATDVFTGVRCLPLPPAPDLSKVRFGKAIKLFNGKDLSGWAVFGGARWASVAAPAPGGRTVEGWIGRDDNVANGWHVQDGLLINDPVQTPGQPRKNYGNLGTTRTFQDFNLTLDFKVPPQGNSGVYLRGIYEIQVLDSYGKERDPHHMGAIYGRVAPAALAERPAGEWQHLDITLVDRHVTVKLNGTLIHDNQPLAGCTGGALWSDESKPGPIYLQGDHTGVTYRNIKLHPVVRR